MLGKLIKYEFLDTYKIICVYYAALAALTVMCIIDGFIMPVDYDFFHSVVNIILSCAYTVMLSMLILLTILALCNHFNKTMYGNRGYLTNTLPVPKGSILAAKYIVSIVWVFASMVAIFLSMMAWLSFENRRNLFALSFEEFAGVPREFMDTFLLEKFNLGLVSFSIFTIIAILAAVLHLFSFLWACLSIGQLANEKRNLLGVAAGIFVGFAEFFTRRLIHQLLSIPLYSVFLNPILIPTGSNPQLGPALIAFIVTSLVFFAIETFATWFISNKRLNLA